jgi:hypothetical protein
MAEYGNPNTGTELCRWAINQADERLNKYAVLRGGGKLGWARISEYAALCRSRGLQYGVNRRIIQKILALN